MRALVLVLIYSFITIGHNLAQIGINTDSSLPENSAMLDIKSTNKGLLVPRLTQSQIMTITNPVNSLLAISSMHTSLLLPNGRKCFSELLRSLPVVVLLLPIPATETYTIPYK